tara:strand:- start:75 stop:212 length:138 start_codon:yes stop_codon:yes gene_type:complete
VKEEYRFHDVLKKVNQRVIPPQVCELMQQDMLKLLDRNSAGECYG